MENSTASPYALLNEILKRYAEDIDAHLVSTLASIATSCEKISKHLWTADGGAKAGSSNTYGDEQLDIDLYADKVVFDNLRACGCVEIAASEENPQEIKLGGKGYSVAFDPLDGSSIIDTNFAVGSIFGIWPGGHLLGQTGRNQVASCMAVYGPRTHLAVALSGKVTGGEPVAFDLTLRPEESTWVISKEKLTIGPSGKVFAPGNLRATFDNPRYKSLFDYWVNERYTLRYTGGMVPDVYYSLIKGKGIFANVSSPLAPAKLRLLYECAPIALLIEAAGGVSIAVPNPGAIPPVDGTPHPVSVLDVLMDDMDARLGVCFGGSNEVDIFNRFMFK
jgi:sedoheptulose-bisphosphatase